MKKRPSTRERELEVENWNLKHPIGTPVRYWTSVREGPGKTGETRSVAEMLGGHTPVVWVTGEGGCVALTHVDVVKAG